MAAHQKVRDPLGVVDHIDVALSARCRSGRGQRVVDFRAQLDQRTERQLVSDDPVDVAKHCAREAQTPHRGNRHGQVQHWRHCHARVISQPDSTVRLSADSSVTAAAATASATAPGLTHATRSKDMAFLTGPPTCRRPRRRACRGWRPVPCARARPRRGSRREEGHLAAHGDAPADVGIGQRAKYGEEGRGLARPVRPAQHGDLAGVGTERQVVGQRAVAPGNAQAVHLHAGPSRREVGGT